MKTLLYMGSYKMLEKSGVGRAIMHQKSVLEDQGVSVTDKMSKDVKVVHINTVLPNAVLTAVGARLRGKKVIYYGHSTMEDFQNSFVGSNALAPVFKQWIKFCYNLGHVIVTPTDYSKNILDSYGLKRHIYPLSNGIDTDFYTGDKGGGSGFRDKYGIGKDEKLVISVGHLIERKGILDFIDMAKAMPEVKFIWFGHTSPSLMTSSVKTAIENATDNLNFAGYVGKETIRDAYNGADIFAFMSHEETEGIVVLEALSCGIPTIVRDIPVYEGWLEDGVNVYKGHSNKDFEVKVEGLLKGRLEDLTRAGAEVANSRSIHKVGDQLTYIYKSLLSADGKHAHA